MTNYAVRRSYKAATTELFDSWQLFYSGLIVDFPPALHNALNPLDQYVGQGKLVCSWWNIIIPSVNNVSENNKVL